MPDFPQHSAAPVPIVAIALFGMKTIALDGYVIDVLMPDLVGHDKKPASFLVLLYLLRVAQQKQSADFEVSLQTIAVKTGLAKSTVQAALRHLKRRGLIDPAVVATTGHPVRRVLRPWNA